MVRLCIQYDKLVFERIFDLIRIQFDVPFGKVVAAQHERLRRIPIADVILIAGDGKALVHLNARR